MAGLLRRSDVVRRFYKIVNNNVQAAWVTDDPRVFHNSRNRLLDT